MEEKIKKLKELIENAGNIVFFGGAGVSTESGIMDFRSEQGLYKLKSKYNAPYEVMLSHSYFVNNTETFYKFYKEFMINTNVKPNAAHIYLARLEKEKNLTIITQNIDGLHQQAGSKNVLELHGSIHRNYCQKCHKMFGLNDIINSNGVPFCDKCGGIIKPDVVLYEEPLNENVINKSLLALEKADLLIIAGTSLNVYPAASFINYFGGSNIVVINKDDLPQLKNVTLKFNDKVGEILQKLM